MFDATPDATSDVTSDSSFDGKFDASFDATLRDDATPNPPRVFAIQCWTSLTSTPENNPTSSRRTTAG